MLMAIRNTDTAGGEDMSADLRPRRQLILCHSLQPTTLQQRLEAD